MATRQEVSYSERRYAHCPSRRGGGLGGGAGRGMGEVEGGLLNNWFLM